jgi:putative hemolysin
MHLTLEIVLILVLLVANGVFAMSEIALVSSRRTRLQRRAEAGDAGAARALALAQDPSRFLSTVQIGITLVGIFAGAFGGATIAGQLAELLSAVPYVQAYSQEIALAIVVGAITFFSLVIGELVPKRVALSNPERIAAAVARPMSALSRVASPAVTALEVASDAVLALFRVKPTAEPAVTQDEIALLIRQATKTGVLHPTEQEIVERVFRLADYRVSAVMTPRRDMIWLDVTDPLEVVRAKTSDRPHSRYPVAEGTLDRIVGVVDIRELWAAGGERFELRKHLDTPLFVPETTGVLRLLEQFRESGIHVAIVLDEYGSAAGLVTPTDVLEGLVGELPDVDEAPGIARREDGSVLVDGSTSVEQLLDELGVTERTRWTEGDYHTVGGLVTTELGHIPKAGERLRLGRYALEVLDMDGHRVDKVLVSQSREGGGSNLEP